MNTENIMLSLLSSELQGTAVSVDVIESIDSDMLSSLYTLSDAHDMAHVVASALSKAEKLGTDAVSEKFKKKALLAVYRKTQQDGELLRICKTLEDSKIPFIPLKGAVIRKYYPEPWMRTSCDIDVLVRETDFKEAVATLKNELGYVAQDEAHYHDISLFSPNGVHLELHFSIRENNASLDRVLDRVWDFASPISEKEHQLVLQDEYLLFYLVAHTAYHFLSGGCGIRPFFDIWLLKKNAEINKEKLSELLDEAGLGKFYNEAEKLSAVWMNHAKHSETTLRMERYILAAGVYGSLENVIGIAKAGKGNFKYIFNRIFMPYSQLKTYYRILYKYPVLYPIYQVVRWVRTLRKNKGKVARELKCSSSMSDEKIRALQEICKELGLK